MTTTVPPEDPAAALRWLVDREAIRALVADFARAIDTKDQARYAANFTEDAHLQLPFGTIEGRAAISAMKGPPPGTHAHHLFGQVVIDLKADSATVITYMTATHVFSETDFSEKAASGGWYEQDVVRTDEGWRFQRVKLVIRWEDKRPMMPEQPNATAEENSDD